MGILQQFIDNQFLSLSSDQDLEKLQKAIEELKKKWPQDKKKLASAVLVAFDPEVNSDDPLIGEVQISIINKWPTFISNVALTKDQPVAYIRAVILETLQQLTEADPLYALLVWHTGLNAVKHFHVGREGRVLRDFILDTGNKIEKEGVLHWQDASNVEFPDLESLNLTIQKEGLPVLDEGALSAHLLAASAHTSIGGGENQHQSNQPQQWPQQFAPRAARGIVEEIRKIAVIQESETQGITKLLSEYFEKLTPYFREVIASLQKSYNATNLKTNLLWWKQALYSHRLKKSYREMNPLTGSLYMAADLAREVPPLHPASVDFFLQETVYSVWKENAVKELSFAQLITEVDNNRAAISELYSDVADTQGRKMLSYFLLERVSKVSSTGLLHQATGLQDTAKITFLDLAIWFFHDIQASRLITSK